jgi:hypothetical protein
MKVIFNIFCLMSIIVTVARSDLHADITIVNSFSCPEASRIDGLDIYDTVNYTWIMFANPTDGKLYFYELDGTYELSIPLTYSNPQPYGCCYNESFGTTYLNDFGNDNMYYSSDYVTWNSYGNPAGVYGRGMDLENGVIFEAWEDGFSNRIYEFSENGGGVASYFEVPEPANGLSGLTLFYYDGVAYFMVTSFYEHNFYFYKYATETCVGSEPIPFSVTNGKGLAYCEDTGTFFFSCKIGDEYYIYELDFNFYDDTGVGAVSFGEIKAAFR